MDNFKFNALIKNSLNNYVFIFRLNYSLRASIDVFIKNIFQNLMENFEELTKICSILFNILL